MTTRMSDAESDEAVSLPLPPAADVARTLTDEWDEAFSWSYGQRFWNVGCG